MSLSQKWDKAMASFNKAKTANSVLKGLGVIFAVGAMPSIILGGSAAAGALAAGSAIAGGLVSSKSMMKKSFGDLNSVSDEMDELIRQKELAEAEAQEAKRLKAEFDASLVMMQKGLPKSVTAPKRASFRHQTVTA